MAITDDLLKVLCALPPEKQRQVLHYAESLKSGTAKRTSRRPLKGMWAHLDCDVTEEDITEARKEMWGNFPRDFPE